MRPSPRRQSAGFTLLEAIVALVILASACIVCMQIRAQSISSHERLARQQRVDRATDAVFQMMINGLLPRPEKDAKSGRPVWRGEHLGKPFEVTRDRVIVANPVAGQVAYQVSPEVSVWKYAIAYEGRTSHFYWNR